MKRNTQLLSMKTNNFNLSNNLLNAYMPEMELCIKIIMKKKKITEIKIFQFNKFLINGFDEISER